MSPIPPAPALHFGTWLSLGSPISAELAVECGFQWLLIDHEHGCGHEAGLLPLLQATRGAKVDRIVRVGAPAPEVILHALDWGADGLMVPHVDDANIAESVVQAAHYPPRGQRGLARTTRAFGYGLRPPVEGKPLPKPIIVAQIESLAAVQNAGAIAAVDGIDVLFVGPTDLGHDLRSRGLAITVEDLLPRVVSAARAAGKQSGLLLRRTEDIPQYLAMGFTWLAVGSDLTVLRDGFLQMMKAAGASATR